MLNFQYDQEVEYQAIREEEREAGASEKAIEMVKNLLASGISADVISNASGLSLQEVEELSKDS